MVGLHVTSTVDATSAPRSESDASVGVSRGGVGAASLKVMASNNADPAGSATTPAPSIHGCRGVSGSLESNVVWDGLPLPPNRIALHHLSHGAKSEWANSVGARWTLLPWKPPKDLKVNATLTIDTAESSSNGRVAAYKYARSRSCCPAPAADDPDARRFSTAARLAATPGVGITPTKTIFTGDASVDISALLWPLAGRGQDGEKVKLDSEVGTTVGLTLWSGPTA